MRAETAVFTQKPRAPVKFSFVLDFQFFFGVKVLCAISLSLSHSDSSCFFIHSQASV